MSYHRGTEDTEKNVFVSEPQALLANKNSVPSVPLW
jgi:hypothetical protein